MKKALQSYIHTLYGFLWIVVGACIAAFSIEVFFIPNNLIDGGTVGVAMIIGRVIGTSWVPLLACLLALPFVLLAIRHIGKIFVLHVAIAIISFAIALTFLPYFITSSFHGDPIEVVVIGGGILGLGIGIIIRMGGCLDGTEILGIICNRKFGFTVGQVVLFCNIGIFIAAGFVFRDWHPALMSLICYIVVTKTMDVVLIGFDETKSVLVISSKHKEIEESVIHILGMGLTVMYGRGGFSGASKEILYIIVERLRLAELKEAIYAIDPGAFIAVETLHEVSTGRSREKGTRNSSSVLLPIVKRILRR